MAAPDSPRSSQSPPPKNGVGDLETELEGLVNALFNLGTTVIADGTKDEGKAPEGKNVGQKVNEVVHYLEKIDEKSQHVRTMIPLQVLADIDGARNPMQLTRERLERAATENQFMNGKIAAIESYQKLLNEALVLHFPELEAHFAEQQASNGLEHSPVKIEPPSMNGHL